ncbi:capsular biosynthesis protein [Achromobacter deleyi]|uniref:capsular biosynthesis protein n=1 Tax=Achromobacter deleyi TaxID=1353891 RepID=UPI002DD43100|nr:capsular biosynthesis protein [Achromobacter deleyi]
MKEYRPVIISTIGSCRVAGPLTKLQAQRNFVLDNRLLYGFTHNTKETVQAIRYMRGEATLPESAWPFISSESLRESNPAHAHIAGTRYVVEISSTKVLELDGKFLQLVRFKEALNFCPELLKIFFDHSSRDALAKRRAALEEAPSFAHVPEHVQLALTHTVLHVQTAQEILDDLKIVQQLLGNDFVLVTHCNAINANGQPIADRAQMVETVKLAANTLGIPLVEPGTLLAHFGQSRGMPDEGRDTAHYTPAFAKLVGRAICEKLLGNGSAESAANAADPLDWKQCIERAKASAKELEWDSALLLTNRAIELKNGSPTAYVLRARAVTALEQTDDILDAWSIALSIDSNRSAFILRQAAEGAMKVGDYGTAQAWASESLDKESDEKTALLLGRVHSKLGQNQQAEAAFRKYSAGDPERALRFATRALTPLADAANMVNALASTPSVDKNSLEAARAAVLKRAAREVKRTGRVGALLPSLSAFYALQSLPQTAQDDHEDQINQAYRRLLKAYETFPEYQNSTETVSLLGRLASLKPVDPRYVQRAAKQLQAQGHARPAIECWQRLANSELPAESDTVTLAAARLTQLGAHQAAAKVYARLSQSGAMDLTSAHEHIDKCLRALARSFRKCLTEERLRDAEDAINGIQSIDPSYQGLISLQRSLADAHKREFLARRSNAANADDVIASAQRVIQASPMDREANIELAMQNLKNGNVAESRRILDRFLQGSPA